MKILHVCLASFYIDNYGYQENILPKMHKLQGHDVFILASTETFIDNVNLGYLKANEYLTNDGIPIKRVSYIKYLPDYFKRKLRIYNGIKDTLNKFKPEIIFLHDVQFLSIFTFIKYLKINKNVTIYADSHTDFNVSARNWISKNILHKIIYKYCAKSIEPYLKYFYGVLPLRNDFIIKVYNISPKKVKLLEMGGDHTNVNFNDKEIIRKKIREKYGIDNDVFLLITGGKIDKYKDIPILIESLIKLNNLKIKLLVFGSIDKSLNYNFYNNHEIIKYIGWQNQNDITNLFLASDLAIFPGRHSVLWEQSTSLGIPGIFKKWDGIQHLNLGGNCIFLDIVTVESITNSILNLYNNKDLFEKMKTIAITKCIPHFSYFEIAKRAIEK
jgi:1,2-diacylglycerol 3-alpha-glucosyltransferase